VTWLKQLTQRFSAQPIVRRDIGPDGNTGDHLHATSQPNTAIKPPSSRYQHVRGFNHAKPSPNAPQISQNRDRSLAWLAIVLDRHQLIDISCRRHPAGVQLIANFVPCLPPLASGIPEGSRHLLPPAAVRPAATYVVSAKCFLLVIRAYRGRFVLQISVSVDFQIFGSSWLVRAL
jgi:hypothetical protein